MKIAFISLPGLDTFIRPIYEALLEDDRFTPTLVIPEGPTQNQQILHAIHMNDVIWLEWANELAISVTTTPGILKGKRVICRCHAYEVLHGLAARVDWSAVDDLIFVSSAIRKLFGQTAHLPGTMWLVPNGVNTQKHPFYSWKKPGYTIGCLGHMSHKKGPMLLIHAFAALLERDPSYRLIISGPQQEFRYKAYLEHIISEMGIEHSVLIEDAVVTDVARWHRRVDFSVCSSPSEGHPFTPMEAMAHGVKPVIHNFIGAKSIFPEDLIWTTIDDFVRIIVDEPYEPKRYREFIESRFSFDRQMDRIKKILLTKRN